MDGLLVELLLAAQFSGLTEPTEPPVAYEPFPPDALEMVDDSGGGEYESKFDLPMKAQIDEKVMEVEK